MSTTFQRWMKEVTRLTRSGRLAEATAAIQRALGRKLNPLAAQRTAQSPLAAVDRCMKELGPQAEQVERAQPDVDGSIQTGEHSEGGLTRSYLLYLPPTQSSQRAGLPMPLVVMLHGCTQDPADFAAGTDMNSLAREQGFAVLYPAQAQSANPSRCWNWFKHNHQRRGSGEAAVLAGMTRAVMAEHHLDPRRVYVAGLSAGGAMAAILGRAYPDLYAAVGIHSGLASGAANDLMSALSAMKHGPASPTSPPAPAQSGEPGGTDHGISTSIGPVPTIVFHGDGDAVVHPGNGTQAIAVAIGQTARNDTVSANPRVEAGESRGGRRYTRTTHPGPEGTPAQAEHWVVHGGGHAWSGGKERGSYTDPSGPDATREMWRFFCTHARTETPIRQG
ncbi:MAG: PHB depolymerase family esterase [Burkholderiaceae bacterium]|nr:PHB depolymerase family esterase [Burkholderiaceae bacterium]